MNNSLRFLHEHNKTNGYEGYSMQFTENPKIKSHVQNVPEMSLNINNMENSKAKEELGCSTYPTILDIKFSNTYWQIFNNNGSTFYLYGAYFGKI